MYPVSDAYAKAMHQPVRQCRTQAKIHLGLFDAMAERQAAVTLPEAVSICDPDQLLEGATTATEYASFETDRFRLDGKLLLIPAREEELEREMGYVSSELSGETGQFTAQTLTISFTEPHSIGALTLTFGSIPEDIPEQITVEGWSGGVLQDSRSFAELAQVSFLDVLLTDVDKLVLRYDLAQRPGRRARLQRIVFGRGYTFGDDDIIAVNLRHTGSLASTSLPCEKLSFTLKDIDGRFSVGSKGTLIPFLQEGQSVRVEFFIDNGWYWEQIPAGEWELSSWDSDGQQAAFSAETPLSRLTSTIYEKGVFDGAAHAADDLAVAVLQDAGVSAFYVDPAMNVARVTAPLPLQSHAACLQLLANRSRAMLYTNRLAGVCLRRSSLTPELLVMAAVSAGQAAWYSDPASIMHEQPAAVYATFEPDFFRLDGSQRLLPDDAVSTGQVVEGSGLTGFYPAGSDGWWDYATEEKRRTLCPYIYSETPFDVYSVTIDFGGQIPARISIGTSEGKGTVWQTFYPRAEIETFRVRLQHVRDVQIRFEQAGREGQRGHISRVWLHNLCEFVLDKEQIFGKPEGRMLARLRNVTGVWSDVLQDAETRTELFSGTMTVNSGWVRIEHDLLLDPQVSCSPSSVTAEAVHYAYVSYIRLIGSEQSADVSVTGAKVFRNAHTMVSGSGVSGEDLPVENPLFDSGDAATVLDWIREHHEKRIQFQVSCKGFPELDCGDYITLWDGGIAQITENQLSYNGAFNQKLTLRR